MKEKKEEKKLSKAEIKKLLVALKEDLNKSLLFATSRKSRTEDLLKRPSAKKLDVNKKARLSRRYLAASESIDEIKDKIEKVDAELRNL